jgi:hypothetical protein
MPARRRTSRNGASSGNGPDAKEAPHAWAFRARFRRAAFGWKSQPAITRVREAVAEIKRVARHEPLVAAEGAILFLERVSAALVQVDSSSGAIGTAVNRAIEELVPIIASAQVSPDVREEWLERLHEAHAAEEIPYIETLGDHWGELCVTKSIASRWADRELQITRHALSPDPEMRGHYHGAIACLAALFRAERYPELIEILEPEKFWSYRRWAVKALAAMGKKKDALRLAEASRGPWTSSIDVARVCEEILLSSGLIDEAFDRHAAEAGHAGTNLATFRAVTKRYPLKSVEEVLERLVASTPGEEGKWFAAAKDAGLLEAAIALARRTPTDPRTLARAARDHVKTAPSFAVEAGLVALEWMALGHGYELTSADVWAAYLPAKEAAERLGKASEFRAKVGQIVAGGEGFVGRVLGGQLGNSAFSPASRW